MSVIHGHLPPRWDVEGAWYFVTAVTRDRRPYFKSAKACHIFKAACKDVARLHPFRLGGLVVLPDHWHALIQPHGKEVVESITGHIKQRVFQTSRREFDNPILWQTRFTDRCIRNEAEYFQYVEYMRLNPCKHELVDSETEAWPWFFIHENPFGRS